MISRFLAGTAIATMVTLFGSAAALAAPIDFGGYTGPISIKFTNYESFTGTGGPSVGNSNYGIFAITTIQNQFGDPLYQSPIGGGTASNPLLLGVFSQILVTGTSGAIPNESTY